MFSKADVAGSRILEDLQKVLDWAVQDKPKRISLRIVAGKSWNESTAVVAVNDVEVTFERPISFSEFGKAVEEAFRKAYGELKVVPISFREELLVNDHVMLRYVPTGSMGIFDIFIVYKDSNLPYRI